MSVTAHAHAAAAPLLSLHQAPCLQLVDTMADKQPSNDKTAHPFFVNNSKHTKTSKQKKINKEKQAKKKELNQATPRGGALETSWCAGKREGEGPGR